MTLLKISNIDENKSRDYEIARIYDQFLFKVKRKNIENENYILKFNFETFFYFYNFLIKIEDEKRIYWFLELDQKPLVNFMNNLFEFEKNIKTILFEYFYNMESSANRNLEIIVFRFFWNHSFDEIHSENIENFLKKEFACDKKMIHKYKKIIKIITHEYVSAKEKQKLFDEIHSIFPVYAFKDSDEFEKYLNEWKELSNLRNQIMHPTSIEELFSNNKINNLINFETRKKWYHEISKIFEKFKENNSPIFTTYIDKLQNDFIKFIGVNQN